MRTPILIILFIISSTVAFAQKDKQNIEAVISGFFNGFSLSNIDTLKYYTTSDFHLLEDGHIWNLDTLTNRINPVKNSDVVRINKFEFIKTEQVGEAAWISYNNFAEFKQGDKQKYVKWLESAVLIKSEGRWKIQMLHSTRLR